MYDLNNTSNTIKNKPANTLNTEIFIERSRAKHGDRYDYSMSIYVRSNDKVKVICKEHGIFLVGAGKHMYGAGCQKCRGFGQTTETLKARLIKARGDRYDYSKSVFEATSKKITIICRIHGEFKQDIWQHENGADCQKCAIERRVNNSKSNFSDLLKIFNKKHNNAYDYSKSVYVNVDTPIEIICKTHGSFFQSPYHHKVSLGCHKCTKPTPFSRSKYIKTCNNGDGKSSIYIVQMSKGNEKFYKVGITKKNVRRRFSTCPYKIKELVVFRSDAGLIWDLEKQVHRLLAKHNYQPKIPFGGSSMECFAVIPKDVVKMIESMRDKTQLQLV